MNVGTYKNNEGYAGDEMELETKVNISKLKVRTVWSFVLCCLSFLLEPHRECTCWGWTDYLCLVKPHCHCSRDKQKVDNKCDDAWILCPFDLRFCGLLGPKGGPKAPKTILNNGWYKIYIIECNQNIHLSQWYCETWGVLGNYGSQWGWQIHSFKYFTLQKLVRPSG